MIVVIAGIALLALVFGPQLWIGQVLTRHGTDRPDLPGSGGELARHLLDEAGLGAVKVELTGDGDHYDPEDRVVRLLPAHYDGRSIAAVAVAAHEVSHAVQHAHNEPAFARRLALVKGFRIIDMLATIVLVSAPLIAIVVRSPVLLFAQIAAGVALLAMRVVLHLVTLPVEFDASFGKALPVLERGGYLSQADLPAARRVLRAAAMTYVAAALKTLLDVTRWLRVFR